MLLTLNLNKNGAQIKFELNLAITQQKYRIKKSFYLKLYKINELILQRFKNRQFSGEEVI